MNILFEEMKKLIEEQNAEKFEFFINAHQELLKEDPVLFISNHVSFYALREDVSKVLEVINFYKNAPYISMTVEDLLNDLKKEVEKINYKKEINDDEIKHNLLSKNEELIAYSINHLSKKNIRNYIGLVEEFLLQEIPYKYKTLMLFILIEQKYEKEIKFTKNGANYIIIPNLLYLPFDSVEYIKTKEEIIKHNLDTQIEQSAIEAMNFCQIKEFPDSYLTIDNYLFMADIFIYIAQSFYKVDESMLNHISKKHQIPLLKCKVLVDNLINVINS